MDEYISVFAKDSMERKQLEKAAKLMTEKSRRGYQYYVGETYFDFGQNWKWTTILTDDFQALYPTEQEAIILSDTPEELEAAVDEYFRGKYCPDK